MGVRLPDTAGPMGDFPGMMAEHIEFADGERLQEKLDNGTLGGGGASYTQLSQADYDDLTDDEKMNGKEYRTYDTGHIYKLGIEYGKDAYFTSLSQLGLTAPTTVGEVFVAMPNKSMLMLNVENVADANVTITDAPHNYGLLTIEKHSNSRFRIEFSNSLGGNASDARKWIGSIKGNDGTGLRWIEITGSAKVYTTMAQLGLDGATATVQDVIDAISVGEIAMLRSDAFNNNNWKTQCNNIQYGYLKIEKTQNGLSNIELQEVVAPNRRYFGTQASGKFAGWTQMNTEEILHTSLSGNLAGITTVLDLVNALLTEYRALSSKKPVRFISGEITKNTLTDFPVTYGVLQITVAGWDVVEVRLAHSANGFKSMYYGFLTRITGQETISSIAWEKVATTTITSLSQLGLTASATLNDVIEKLGAGQSATLTTMDFTNYQTLFPYSEEQDAYATVHVEKGYDVNGSRTIVEWVRKDASKVAYGGLGSNNKVSWWNEYALKSYVDRKTGGIDVAQTDITINTNWATQETRADCPTNKYVVKNGICYLSATFTTLADKNYSATMANLATGLPKPAIGCFANVASGSNKNALVYIHNDGVLKGSSLSTSTLYNVSLTYPVAE